MGSIRFLGRARGGRCVFCHGSLSGDVQTCPECGATWHPECGAGARRCSTAGCSAQEPLDLDHPRPGPVARAGLYGRLALSALLNALVAGAATAFLAFAVLRWATLWELLSTGEDGRRNAPLGVALLAALSIAVAVVALLVTGRRLLALPGILREVSALLADTRPTAMVLSVYKRLDGKNDDGGDRLAWMARLVGGGATLTIDLEGASSPGWLTKPPYVDSQVLVYGLPPPGPYVIEFPDGALALVHPD